MSTKSAKGAGRRPSSPEPSSSAATAATPDAAPLLDGLIVDGSRGLYRVETASGLLACTIRGRLRKQLVYPTSATAHRSVRKVEVSAHDPVAVGDRVRVLPTGGGSGVIEELVARAGGTFTRADPAAGRGDLSVTTVVGLDQLVAVFAVRDPEPHLRLLDRLLVVAEDQGLAAVVCLNKADLGPPPGLEARLDAYRAAGYPALLTSATSGQGVDDLRVRLAGHTSALLGPSGVGKSSLLNALQPDLAQRVGDISRSTGKGRHTTTSARLVPLDGPDGGHLADTAGIRALALRGVDAGRLERCFPEFRPHRDRCRFAGCSHVHEPDCAVRAAVAAGAVDRERFESYRRLRLGGEGEDDLQ